MKILLLLILSIFLVSCGAEEIKEVTNINVVEEADTISGVETEEVIQSKEFVNPNLK